MFLIAYLKLPEFEGRSTLSTWIFGICRRVAGGYRRARREIAFDPAGIASLLGASAADAWSVAPDAEVRVGGVTALLKRLPPGQRAAFGLYAIEEMAGSEVARQLGLTEPAAWSRIRRARRTLARSLHRLQSTG